MGYHQSGLSTESICIKKHESRLNMEWGKEGSFTAPEIVKARDIGAPTQGRGSGDGRNELKRTTEGGEDGIWCLDIDMKCRRCGDLRGFFIL